jgi:hypothetical protein
MSNSTTIKITHSSGESLLVRCNLANAASPILVNYLVDNGWCHTQWQCANTRHSEPGLARIGMNLLAEACEMEMIASEYEWEQIDRLNADADTEHETAEEWYDSYGWHLTTENAGDAFLQAVEYDWLDDYDDDAVIARLLESDDQLNRDEAASMVTKAREIRECAESICDLLDEAVEAYQQGDADKVEELLDAAKSHESDHGDSPASDSLRSSLLASLDSEILDALRQPLSA